MTKVAGLAAIAAGLALFGPISASYAGCAQLRTESTILISDCESGTHWKQSQQVSEFASPPGDNGQRLVAANQGEGSVSANNGIRRYICTPSGFGQIATCTLRNVN